MEDVPARIEHTALGPETTWDDVTAALDAALRHGMRACIPPQHVGAAADYAPTVDLTTVVGFPHGQHHTETKVAAARTARADGVDEIDLVPDHGSLLAGETDAYAAEITEVVAAVPVPVKVIVETGLLEESQRAAAAEAAVEADAAFLKTSTGFVAGGATTEAVSALARHLPVKASGGIDSWETAESMFAAGAERIGASAGATIVEEWEKTTEG